MPKYCSVSVPILKVLDMTSTVKKYFLALCFIISSFDHVDPTPPVDSNIVTEKEDNCKGNFNIIFRWDTHLDIQLYLCSV